MAGSDDVAIDHYTILGFPSDANSTKFSLEDITKAYKNKARELHPDKRRDVSAAIATAEFQQLTSSYEILKDTSARKAFDALLSVRRHRTQLRSQVQSKRQKLASDLEERERKGERDEFDPRREEKAAAARLKVEIERIRAKMRASRDGGGERGQQDRSNGDGGGGGVMGLGEKEKVLKVSWEREGGEQYGADSLRKLFEKFGEVEDVMIRERGGKKRKKIAFIVMKSRDAVVSMVLHYIPSLPVLCFPSILFR